MCTLSIIPSRPDGPAGPVVGFRVVASRDEQRDRPPALAPRWRPLNPLLAADPAPAPVATRGIWPTDPRGGGTWIGGSDIGLVLALLNMNPEPPPALPGALVSRGAIIPRLIASPSADAAMTTLEAIELDRFAPFRLVAIHADDDGAPRVLEASWDRSRFGIRAWPGAWACFASSGLGDSRVIPRVRLFEGLMSQGDPTPEVQDRYHLHVWPDRPALSVLMARPDARTVSITTVEVGPRPGALPLVRMHYKPVLVEARAAREIPVAARATGSDARV